MFKQKYLKYKEKYLELKKQIGGENNELLEAIDDNNLEKVKILLKNGANVNTKDKFGNTALMHSVFNNNYEMVQLLIKQNPFINITNKDGLNAYFIACKNMNDPIAKLLINARSDTTLTNENNQQCVIKTDTKVPALESVPIQEQKYGDCFTHSVARNFVRTLQILGIIKSEYKNQFYDLFYSIINKKFSCNSGENYNSSKYLLDYLRVDIKKIFEIDKDNIVCNNIKDCQITVGDNKILNLTEADKQSFIDDMNKIHNLLYIIVIIYKPNTNSPNYPSLEIKKMLDQKLQPTVGIIYSKYLLSYSDKKTNLVPTIPLSYTQLVNNSELDCGKLKSGYAAGHAVNLRKWMKSYVEFKNSWGADVYNSGNFSVTDIKQLSCRSDDNSYTYIDFTSLMFDESLLPSDIRDKYNIIKSSLHNTCDIENNFDTNSKILIYKIYPNGDIYEGEWLNDKKHGQGKMTYANGDIYYGDWKNDKKHGQGIMAYVNADYVYEGGWLNDKKHGQGIMVYANGDVYDGDWVNDEPVK
jgi:hypothetical protein